MIVFSSLKEKSVARDELLMDEIPNSQTILDSVVSFKRLTRKVFLCKDRQWIFPPTESWLLDRCGAAQPYFRIDCR